TSYSGADAKLGASRAICSYPAYKTVARRKRRFLLHRISAAPHIDIGARKSGKLHLHLPLVSRWRWNLLLNDCDLRLVSEPGDQGLLNHCHSLVDTTFAPNITPLTTSAMRQSTRSNPDLNRERQCTSPMPVQRPSGSDLAPRTSHCVSLRAL